MRVYKMAVKLAKKENACIGIVALVSLLHDVDDEKLSPETYKNKDNARNFLRSHNVQEDSIGKICRIIDEVSFVGTDSVVPDSIEGKCVQDADRLDGIGAIGIARTFAYGGNRGLEIYNPEIKPKLGMSKDEYRTNKGTSFNHFFEKLFLLKDMMNTESARRVAIERENFMRSFTEEFLVEWDCSDVA